MATVLLIEDEIVLARNIGIALTRSGHQVTQSNSIVAARHCLNEAHFDLIIADISLGDGDGIELLREYDAWLAGVPVIVMTGQDSVVNRTRADDMAVAVFLAKPFALSRLTEIVASLLRSDTGVVQPSGDNQSVVMYSHDTIGLGHMRRNTAIASALIAQVPGLSVLLLVGCPNGLVFETQPGIDFIKLPSLTKLGRNRFQAGALRLDSQTTRDIRAGIVERVLSTLRPDVFLVDHEPVGVWSELEPALRQLRSNGNTRVILGLRDILDDPERLRHKWSDSGTDALIAELYDQILIYGNKTFYPSAECYGLTELKPGKADYCGVVTSAIAQRRPQRLKIPRRIVVSGGGGRDAYPLIDASLSAFKLIPKRKRPSLTLVAGPLMEAELSLELAAKAEQMGATFYTSVPDFPRLLTGSDLFLSMGGYNSVNESLVVGCPTVIVPRVGPSSEQRIRAARADELGLGQVLYRESLTPENLKQIMIRPVKPPSERTLAQFDFNGAAAAAHHIAAHLPCPVATLGDRKQGAFAHVIPV